MPVKSQGKTSSSSPLITFISSSLSPTRTHAAFVVYCGVFAPQSGVYVDEGWQCESLVLLQKI